MPQHIYGDKDLSYDEIERIRKMKSTLPFHTEFDVIVHRVDELETGMFADTVEVPCMDVLVVANPDLETKALEDLATSVMMDSNRIQGK